MANTCDKRGVRKNIFPKKNKLFLRKKYLRKKYYMKLWLVYDEISSE